jgi:ATP-dependent Clp protease ATP-binding subunit ClpB
MTSNLGAEFLVNQGEDENVNAVRDQVMQIVRASFRPEFLNRIDDILLFSRLRKDQMGAIVDIQLRRVQALLDERNIAIIVSDKAKDWLAEQGYDPSYGARPLKRVIQRQVQDPLAEKILSGDILDGQSIHISPGDDRLLFLANSSEAA